MTHQWQNPDDSLTDKVAWALCQIIDDDAPLRWARYRFVAGCIARNQDLMSDLTELAKQEGGLP